MQHIHTHNSALRTDYFLVPIHAWLTWAQFHGSAYRKHRIGDYGSGEFCAYGKGISPDSGEFWFLR